MRKLMGNRHILLQVLSFCICLVTTFSLVAQDQNHPKLHCLMVDNNSIQASVQPPTDMSGFTQFALYRSTNGGLSFSVVATGTDPLNFGLTDVGFNANIPGLEVMYFVQIRKGNGNFNSDTMSVFHAQAVNYGDGTAHVTWNAPRSSFLPTDEGSYHIDRKTSTGLWELEVASVNRNAPRLWIDHSTVCSDSVRYRVHIRDSYPNAPAGSINRSTFGTDLMENMTKPPTPVLDSVSVDNSTGTIVLGWDPSPDVSVDKYIIYVYTVSGGVPGWPPVDTVYGRFTTTWVDQVRPPDAVHRYRIASLNSCGTEWSSSNMIDSAQSNMVLSVSNLDACTRTALLTWNPYVNMIGNINKYEIWLSSDNGTTYTRVGTTTSNSTTFTLQSIALNTPYLCFVKAVNGSGSIKSSSSLVAFIIDEVVREEICYIKTVTVEDDKNIRVDIYTKDTQYDYLEIWRSENDTLHFTKIGSISYNGSDLNSYLDLNELKVKLNTYFYRANLISQCSENPLHSNIAHNILLTGESTDAHVNNLKWLNYGKWDGGVDEYTLQRKAEADLTFTDVLTGIMPAPIQNSASDDVSDLFTSGSVFVYKVMAAENLDQYNFTATSISNTVELQQLPTTYIPNVFTPLKTTNTFFKPYNSFVSSVDYHLYIFDRWGELLFHTTDPNDGWNGYARNGKLVLEGVYVWKLHYKYDNDKIYEKDGTVMVLY